MNDENTIYTRTKESLKERLMSISEDEKIVIELDVFLPISESKESKHQYLDVDILPIKVTEKLLIEDDITEAQDAAEFQCFLETICSFINNYSKGIIEVEYEESQQDGTYNNFTFFRNGEEHLPTTDSTVIMVRVFAHLQSSETTTWKKEEHKDKFAEPIVIFNKNSSLKFNGYRAAKHELKRLIHQQQ
jgi:hypothetical protein